MINDKLSAHTPGPWQVATGQNEADGIKHASGFVAFAAFPHHLSEEKLPGEIWLEMRARKASDRHAVESERLANARLIAAAPELLDAVLTMIQWDEAEKNAKPFDDDNGKAFYERMNLCSLAFEKARLALAKVNYVDEAAR